ncbi:MAG: histidinol-phosphatase [Oligoflexia bacterium]|nr:histidinol-phosphatase [Oligoflexia bacterium]
MNDYAPQTTHNYWKEWIDKRADLHNHTIFSDGKSTAEEVIQAAIAHNLEIVGISDHAPLPFTGIKWCIAQERLSAYIKELIGLKNKYRDKIKVLVGMEIAYFEGCEAHLRTLPWSLLDYAIGSVHFFSYKKANGNPFGIDSSALEFATAVLAAENIQNICRDYYSLVIKAAQSGHFTFIGHFDLVKKFNLNYAYFKPEEDWYQQMSLQALKEVSKTGVPLEVNTSAKRKGHDEYYPSTVLIKEAIRLNIPLFFNSDSHHCQDVGYGRLPLNNNIQAQQLY